MHEKSFITSGPGCFTILAIRCHVTVSIFLSSSSSRVTKPWVWLKSVIVAFPGHTHLLFVIILYLCTLLPTNSEVSLPNVEQFFAMNF